MNLRRTIANPVTLAGLLILAGALKSCRTCPAMPTAQTPVQRASLSGAIMDSLTLNDTTRSNYKAAIGILLRNTMPDKHLRYCNVKALVGGGPTFEASFVDPK